MATTQEQSLSEAIYAGTETDVEIKSPLQQYYASQALAQIEASHAGTETEAESTPQISYQAMEPAQNHSLSEESRAGILTEAELQSALQPYYVSQALTQSQADQARVLTDAELQSRLEQHFTSQALAHGTTINRQTLQHDVTVNTQAEHQRSFQPLPVVMITQPWISFNTNIQFPTYVVNVPDQDPPCFVHIRIGLPLEAAGMVDSVWTADVKDPDSFVTIKIKHDINGRLWYEISVRNLTNFRTGFQVEILHLDLVAASQDVSFVRATMMPSFDPRNLPWSYSG